MNFELTAEQKLLQESVERFVRDTYSLDTRQQHVAGKTGFGATNWSIMAELGWLALPFASEDGGFGGNQIDTMVLMEQFGKGLVVEPYLASIVMGGGAMRHASASLRAEILPGVMRGTRQLALAYAEPQAGFDIDNVATAARRDGDCYVLNGHKSMVLHGGTAQQIVVSARTSGSQTDRTAISLFLVDVDVDGLKCSAFPTVDGLRAAELHLKDVRVPASRVIGTVGGGFPILNEVANDTILALCAEAVGAMEVLYKDTVAYTQERIQFDQPLASFQVLQHRMVDMFIEYEQCRSLLYRATLEAAQQGSVAAQRTIHALKHLVGRAGLFIAENAVQLHGGMGMTEELRIGHHFKRLLVIDTQFGNSDYHLQRFAA